MKKQATEELWRVCFNDTEEFIRLFFDNVYQEENTLVIEKRGQLVSALQIIPYTLWMEGKEVPVAYICGVCTHPDERGKGYMNQLMREADELLKHRNIPLASLIPAEPWLFDVYRKGGYAEAFYDSMECYFPASPVEEDSNPISTTSLPVPEAYLYFDKKLRERRACMLHTEADFRIIRKDLAIENGNVFVAKNKEGDLSGMAFARPGGEREVVMTELLFDNDSAKEQLLGYAARFYNAERVCYKRPPYSGEAKPKGMAKLLDNDYFKERDLNAGSLFSTRTACMTLMLD